MKKLGKMVQKWFKGKKDENYENSMYGGEKLRKWFEVVEKENYEGKKKKKCYEKNGDVEFWIEYGSNERLIE